MARNGHATQKGRVRLTTIRDILQEMEEDDRREAASVSSEASEDTSTESGMHGRRSRPSTASKSCTQSGSNKITNGNRSDVQENDSGIKHIVVCMPSTGTKLNQEQRRKSNCSVSGVNDSIHLKSNHRKSSVNSNPRISSANIRNGIKSKRTRNLSDDTETQTSKKTNKDEINASDCNTASIATIGTQSSDSKQQAETCAEDQFKKSVSKIEDDEISDSEQSTAELDKWAISQFDMEQMHFLPKLLTERGSMPFHNVMNEMKSEIKKKKQRREGFKSAIKISMFLKGVSERKAKEREQMELESISDSNEDEEDEECIPTPQPKTFRSMSRGWKLLNMAVQEEHLQRKKEEATKGWNLLTKTISHLTNEEKARQELYKRYIYNPNSWAEGLSNYPQFLRERKGSVTSSASVETHSRPRPRTAFASSDIHKHGGKSAEQFVDSDTKSNKDGKHNGLRTNGLLHRRPISGHV